MSIPSMQQVFEFGINAAPPGPSKPDSLENVVRCQLAAASREMAMMNALSPGGTTQNLITDIGKYLTQTAQMWLCLTNKLVQGSHVEMAAEDAHQQSHREHRDADLETMVRMDLNIMRLR